MVIDDTLQDLVLRALAQADARDDFLIAALLSQCATMLEQRRPLPD